MNLNRTTTLALLVLPLLAGCFTTSEPEPMPSSGQRGGAGGSVSGNPTSGGGTTSSGDTSGSGNGTSSGSGSGSDAGTAATTGHRVFVTSTVYNGNMGGAAGADAHCQTVADAKALGGTWVAWIADGQSSPTVRLTATGPWSTVSGMEVFKNRANLLTVPETFLPDESGNYPQWTGKSSPWTGVDEGAKPTGYDCGGWLSAAVSSNGTTASAREDQTWGGGGSPIDCDAKAPLICFEN